MFTSKQERVFNCFDCDAGVLRQLARVNKDFFSYVFFFSFGRGSTSIFYFVYYLTIICGNCIFYKLFYWHGKIHKSLNNDSMSVNVSLKNIDVKYSTVIKHKIFNLQYICITYLQYMYMQYDHTSSSTQNMSCLTEKSDK